jgi:hypothetical protein
MSLEGLLTTELPMNRKERFFTGTVFPMIVCADEFKHFDRLMALMPESPGLSIDPDPDKTNIEFFTEYGLMESIYGPSKERFVEPLDYRDTPDIICLVKDEQKTLIAFEAKMYDRPSREAVEEQMRRQREFVLDYLQVALSVKTVLHAALLPQGLLDEFGGFGYPVITWEAVLDAFAADRRDDYWLRMLRLALSAWPDLVGPGAEFSRNADDRLRGSEIMSRFERGDAEFALMGRNDGLNGGPLEGDLKSGGWRKQVYQVRREGLLPNKRNWFLIADFVDEVKRHAREE